MIGEPRITMVQGKGTTPSINYRGIVALVAPFKDDSFIFKSYKTIQEALTAQATTASEAVGYKYLQILDNLGYNKDIVLCNTTTSTGEVGEPTYDYTLTNDKLGEIFTELEGVGISILCIPYELSSEQFSMYKSFFDSEIGKMNAFGLITQITPTVEKMESLSTQFRTGGIYKIVTTPIANGYNNYNLSESCVYNAGITANLNENISETFYILDGVTGQTTKEAYGNEIYQAIINNGGLAVGFMDKINNILHIVNSNTPTMKDLKIERVYHLIINEVRRRLENNIGKDNNVPLTYPLLTTQLSIVKSNFIDNNYITDLTYSLNKTSQDTAQLIIKVNEDDIIGHFDVIMDLEINGANESINNISINAEEA